MAVLIFNWFTFPLSNLCVFVCVTLCNTGFIGLLSRIVKGSLEPSHQQHQPEQQCMCECV